MSQHLRPAFVEIEPAGFKPARDCTVQELRAAEALQREQRPADQVRLRGIRRWIELCEA